MSILLSQASLGSGLQPSASASLQDLSKRRDSESTDSVTGSRIGLRSPSCSPTLGEFRLGGGPSSNSLAAGRNVPVHCVVERVPGPQSCSPTGEPGVPTVEQDSFAIVPHGTPFNDLVRTALLRLGYSASEAVGAKGAIQLKNWKPLAFDQITDAPEATVGEILGELFTVATLRVRLYRSPDTTSIPQEPTQWSDAAVRGAVLELLREMSQKQLAKICPLSQPLLSGIVNGKYRGRIGSEKRQQFGNWYIEYRRSSPLPGNGRVLASDRPQESRMTFHTTRELPLMRDWFRACKNPSGRTLQMYVDLLNQGPVRQRERPKVTLECLRNWWKNERQRERRQQTKPGEEPPLKKQRKSIKKVEHQVQTDPPDVEVDVVHPDPPEIHNHPPLHHHHHHHHQPVPRYEIPHEPLHLPT